MRGFDGRTFCGVVLNKLFCLSAGVVGDVPVASIEFVLQATGELFLALAGINFLPKSENDKRPSSGTSKGQM